MSANPTTDPFKAFFDHEAGGIRHSVFVKGSPTREKVSDVVTFLRERICAEA